MFDFERFLKNNPNGTMGATDGYTVTMRFMRYLFNEDNRVFFCTNSRKRLCGLLRENPRVTFSTHQPDFGTAMSLYGTAEFCDDILLKKRLLDENSLMKDLYSSADNPDFVLFYIFVETIETFSSKDGVRTYRILDNQYDAKSAAP